jgi:hypothetical protein
VLVGITPELDSINTLQTSSLKEADQLPFDCQKPIKLIQTTACPARSSIPWQTLCQAFAADGNLEIVGPNPSNQ